MNKIPQILCRFRYDLVDLIEPNQRRSRAYRIAITINKNDFHIAKKRALINKTFEEYTEFGGFPEIINFAAKRSYRRELFDKIITQNIISRYNIKHISDLYSCCDG